MKKLCLFIFLCLAASFVYAQSKCNIKKAWAFYTLSYPGVQMSDENGNPLQPKTTIERFIYIEWCGSKKPDVTEVLYNNISFSAVVEKVEGKSVIPGKDLSPENTNRIRVSGCKKLWKLILVPKEEDKVPEPGSKQIVIKTRSPGACAFKLAKETRLMTLPRP